MKHSTGTPFLVLASALVLATVRCSPSVTDWGDDSDMASLPADDGVYVRTYYVDPASGSDANDGLSPATAFASLEPLASIYPPPDSKVALKRGTVLRPRSTFNLKGGTSSGWVTYGAYGDPSLPKPIVAGSVAIPSSAWRATGESGVYELDWSPHLDTGGGRSATGVEQGPGNLWFFEDASASARMTLWGWRRPGNISSASAHGDWFHDAPAKRIRLRWDGAAPALTEAALNRTMMSYAGQSYVIVEELDLRYGGGYVFAGHEVAHLRLRRLDISFSGGGTKNGSYVRLGNGIEVSGNARDVEVSACRLHQLYDTGMDPQNTGTRAVTQRWLTFRGNLVSYAGLASFELWVRPDGSRLSKVLLDSNTFLHAGRGWGYEQHDHAGQSKVGGDIVIFDNRADSTDITVQNNVFHHPRVVLLSEFRADHPKTQALLRGMTLNHNLWSLGSGAGATGVVLFRGTVSSTGDAELGDSIVYADLAAWRASTEVSGKDATSIEGAPGFANPSDPPEQDLAWLRGLAPDSSLRPTRFGPFALAGDYACAFNGGAVPGSSAAPRVPTAPRSPARAGSSLTPKPRPNPESWKLARMPPI